ncbi:hypothetical protein JAAARDRAFT_172637 [Jaapia argillacea MUCL 33604]|uniref:SEC7 domain-containing protein n=1 Tax=Jaapia argillacea MUCL 33604 TaxID=933084 RepID=A0A067Q0X8_9AGAM|nr:hypothetical protein JAAARDRAFT_172637 [Jaapia argillacea MUCL 33604]
MLPYSPANGTVTLKHVLEAEILSVTSVMRKNSRWASSAHTFNARDSTLASNLGLRLSVPSSSSHGSQRGGRERELMAGFQDLKRVVRDVDDIETLPLPTLLAPFFAIIRSPLSTGPITSAALSALHNFFICGLITTNSPSLEKALGELSSTVSHCKFDASDSSGDEVVLLKILMVIQDSICGPVGGSLGDMEVCEMLETVLTTCCQMRLSEILRRSAESTMHDIVRNIFSRLHALDPVEEERKLQSADDVPQGELSMSVSTSLPLVDDSTSSQGADNTPDEHHQGGFNPEDSNAPKPEFGLPSIVELLRVLINILDPNDRLHTDSTRLTALGILNVAFEVSGPRIGEFPSLAALVLNDGCKFMFQLARSENPGVLHMALRTISTMFNTMRRRLKLQQELFLAFTIDRLVPPPSGSQKGTPRSSTPSVASPYMSPAAGGEGEKASPTPPRPFVNPARGETRELMMEILCQIARHPSFAVDCYTNYDCDINCEDLFERLVDFLTRGVRPSPFAGGFEALQQNSQYLCLDLLLAFVNHMAARADGSSQPWPSTFAQPEDLLKKKSQKMLVMTGAARFNAKPKTGISFLEENGLIFADLSPDVSRPLSLAKFLKSCTRLDKRLLGDYISKPENLDVLKAFIGLFDFTNKQVADAMRELLETFRLPGESQQISRITETFAEIYFASQPAEIKSQDAVYVLAYSVIMLNTDLHNPQIRKRMSLEDYQRNLRGVNDRSDFSVEFLRNIYESIRKQEIIMPEEHTGQLGFEYAWKELLARSRQSGEFFICNTAAFDLEMFKSSWKPIIAAIAYAFISFDDDYFIERAIAGFRQCATLAGHFHLPDVFDYVVVSLSQATSLLAEVLPTPIPNYPVVEVEGQSVTVSSLSVKFGTNFKGQLAAVVLFNIVNGNGNALREGWTQIFEMFLNLFLNSLLPTRMLQMEDFLGGVSMIPLRGTQPPRATARSEGGLLSTLSSYLMTPYSSNSEAEIPDATDADVESTLCTMDCITSCRLDELYAQIMQLDLEPLVAVVRALEALAHERTVARLRQESDDVSSAFDTALPPLDGHTLPYDPASVFLLETMVSIASHTPQYIEDIWPILFEHLSSLLSVPHQYSVLLIERAVVGLLRLCRIVAHKASLRDQVYVSFDLLGSLPPAVAGSVGEQIVSGLVLVLQDSPDIVSSQTEWNLIFTLLRKTIQHGEAAGQSFDLIERIASDAPVQKVTLDNFLGLVDILEEFASAAGTTVIGQQRQGRRGAMINSSNSHVVDRGRRAIEVLSLLHKSIPRLLESSSNPGQEWRRICLPLLTALSRQSTNASREVRHNAISQLQRILLGPNMAFGLHDYDEAQDTFSVVIFPLLDSLLKPQVFQLDPQGMPETRLRASVLLCKAFMHFEIREGQSEPGLKLVWLQVLDILERFMRDDTTDTMHEAIPESLKNVILVMNATGILAPPSPNEDENQPQPQGLWQVTHQKIEAFLPRFLEEVIPPPNPPSAPPDPSVETSL